MTQVPGAGFLRLMRADHVEPVPLSLILLDCPHRKPPTAAASLTVIGRVREETDNSSVTPTLPRFLDAFGGGGAAAGRVRAVSKKPWRLRRRCCCCCLDRRSSKSRSVLLEKSEKREKKGRKETAAASRHLVEGANDLHVGGAGRSTRTTNLRRWFNSFFDAWNGHRVARSRR